MAMIKWKESYEVGIASIDREHKELFEQINALHSDLHDEQAVEPADGVRCGVIEFLADLYTSIETHFLLEERIMRELGYGSYLEHKDDHESLLNELRATMDDYEDGGEADYEKRLAVSLRSWFANHFQKVDEPLHRFIENTGGLAGSED
jgi:hemerythrin